MKSNIDCRAFDTDSIIFAGNNIWVDNPIVIVWRCSTSSYYTFPNNLIINPSNWKKEYCRQFFFGLISWLFEYSLKRWKKSITCRYSQKSPTLGLQVFKSNASNKQKGFKLFIRHQQQIKHGFEPVFLFNKQAYILLLQLLPFPSFYFNF